MDKISEFIDSTIAEIIAKEHRKIRQREIWLTKFRRIEIPRLPSTVWKEEKLFHQIPKKVSKYLRIAAVDGGLIQQELRGFDLILTRAVVPIFKGLGDRVTVEYFPEFNPRPQFSIHPSFESRQQLSRIATLKRLKTEYEIALQALQVQKPKILFIDGSVKPLKSDFSNVNETEILQVLENEVKSIYLELVRESIRNETILIGLVKDSRSRELATHLSSTIIQWIRERKIKTEEIKGHRLVLTTILDAELCSYLLEVGQRTAWFQSLTPSWIPLNPKIEFWISYIKPVANDLPLRIEVVYPIGEGWFKKHLDLALGSLYVMSQHGLETSLPSILMEADERAKIPLTTAEFIVEQLAMMLGVPLSFLKKRRSYLLDMDNS